MMSATAPFPYKGSWIAAVARRVFAPDSFALLIEPAIADLQHDGSPRLASEIEGYGAVWLGVGAACEQDALGRARGLVHDNDIRTIVGLALLHTMHSCWLLVLLLGIDGRVNLKRMIATALRVGAAPIELAVVGLTATAVIYMVGSCLLVREPIMRGSITGRTRQ